MRRYALCVFALLALAPAVLADNITLSVNQTDYYFLIGEDATIPLNTHNSYGETIYGAISYTISQQLQQQGFMYSSMNTQSAPTSIPDGDGILDLRMQTSDAPATMGLGLVFTYEMNGTKSVSLDGIRIHFISNESQRLSSGHPLQSSESAQQGRPGGQQSQQQQQFRQQLHQQLQNNQMAQDTSVLKRELQQQQENTDMFRRNVEQNPDFQKAQRELEGRGYNRTDSSFSPVSNDTGSFEVKYRSESGKNVTLKGRMKDNNIVALEEQEEKPEHGERTPVWLLLMAAALTGAALLGAYLFYKRKSNSENMRAAAIPEEEQFDYSSEAKRLLSEAEGLFEKKRYKEAYGTANRAVRLYLAYENGLDAEISNDRLLGYLRRHKKPYAKLRDCFESCSLVEFAKRDGTDKNSFERVLRTARGIIYGQ